MVIALKERVLWFSVRYTIVQQFSCCTVRLHTRGEADGERTYKVTRTLMVVSVRASGLSSQEVDGEGDVAAWKGISSRGGDE